MHAVRALPAAFERYGEGVAPAARGRRNPTAGVFAVVASAWLIAACGGDGEAADPTPLPPIVAPDEVVADAVVVPVRHASLSFTSGGTVQRVRVSEGDEVKKGQELVRLDSAAEAAAVLQARADLAAAEANLTGLLDGPGAEQVAAAEAAVAAAEAGARSADGQVAAAAAGRDKVVTGATASDLAVAQTRVKSARNLLWGAQAQRDAICGRVDGPFAEQADCDQAEAEVGRMHEEVRIAELQLNELFIGARKEDVSAANAGVSQASGQRDVARADAARARAELQRLLAGATEAELDAARARVDQALATLELAQVRLDNTILRAPITGEVAAVDVRPGEAVAPGTPVVRVADTSEWRFESDDLTELGIVDVRIGAPAEITIDALPGTVIDAAVDRIRAFGENKLGDITYRVTLVPARHEPRLRWNMTASVRIESDPGDDR